MRTKIPLPDKEEFKNYYFNHTNQECAEKYKISKETIRTWCEFLNIKKEVLIKIPDIEEFRYYFLNYKNIECAKKYGVSISTIYKWVRYFGLKKDTSIPIPDKEEFKEYFINNSNSECAKKYNVSLSSITKWVRYFGLKKDTSIPIPDKEEFKNYYFNHTNYECSEKYNVSISSIDKWVRYLKITKTIPLPNKEEFIDYYFSNSQEQSAIKYGVSIDTLKKWLSDFNMSSKKIWKYTLSHSDLKFTECQSNIFIGTMLGDSSITYKGVNTNSQYVLGHCSKQIEYLKSISCLLFPFTKKNKTCGNRKDGSKMIQSINHKIFTEYEKIWYLRDKNGNHIMKQVGNNGRKQRIKIVPKNFILNPEILAYWYFDDGCLDKSSRRITLHTNGFTEEDVNYLIFRLKKDLDFNEPKLKVVKKKEPIIRFSMGDLYHFMDLVKPFNKFKCLQYKTDISDLKKPIILTSLRTFTDDRIKSHEKMNCKSGIALSYFRKDRNTYNVRTTINKTMIYFGSFSKKTDARKVSNDILELKKQGITDIDEYLKIKEKYKDLKNNK